MCEIVLRHFCHTQNLARAYLSVIIVFSYSHFVSSIACVRVRTMLYCTVHNVIVSGIECDLQIERETDTGQVVTGNGRRIMATSPRETAETTAAEECRMCPCYEHAIQLLGQ